MGKGFNTSVVVAVDKLSKNVSFLQPLFEAISNSLEAGAKDIKIKFDTENCIPKITPKIVGFSIEDDGCGFTEEQRNAFNELWTKNKIDLGCKGFGRLTWLRVFNEILIESYTSKEKINIIFTKDYDTGNDIKIEESSNARKTKITFCNVSDKFYKVAENSKEQNIDNREIADLSKIVDKVEKHLLVKLYLLKKQGVKFNIRFFLKDQEEKLTDDNMKELSRESFNITGIDQKDYLFDIYYSFIENKDKKQDLFYCADNRTIKKFQSEINLDNLPSEDSVIMLLCSDYLNSRVNDERTDFIIENKETLIDPVNFERINLNLKNKVKNICLKKYPEITKENEKEEQEAINEVPYLKKYIKQVDSIIKNKNDLINTAKSKYETEKNYIKERFKKILEDKKLDTDKFIKTMEDVSDIATRELGAYFVYRQQIIDGLKKLSDKREKLEELLHNLFLTKGEKDLSGLEKSNKYDNNIWLLDDKFMSYSSIFSDTKIKTILEELGKECLNKYGSQKEPDITAFYSKENGSKDLLYRI